MLRCMLIGSLIGVATEVAARAFKLWIYRQPQTPVLNVIVMFGVLMGGVAGFVPRIGLLRAFLIAFGIGLLYEIANLQFLNWWYFPGERLAVVRGHAAIVVVLALLWGALPVMIAMAPSRLPTASFSRPARSPASTQTRLEALEERERQLIDKLEAVRQRERDLQTRLDETRALKEALLARQAVRRPGAHDDTPIP